MHKKYKLASQFSYQHTQNILTIPPWLDIVILYSPGVRIQFNLPLTKVHMFFFCVLAHTKTHNSIAYLYWLGKATKASSIHT